jgi:hypothetical protein
MSQRNASRSQYSKAKRAVPRSAGSVLAPRWLGTDSMLALYWLRVLPERRQNERRRRSVGFLSPGCRSESQ